MIFECENSVAPAPRQQGLPVQETTAWLSTPQAAALAGVHRSTMTRLCEQLGKSFAIKVGRNWKIRKSSFDRLLSEGAIREAEQVEDQG